MYISLINRALLHARQRLQRNHESMKVRKRWIRSADLKGLILDLRGNPGGLLSEGVGVADKS